MKLRICWIIEVFKGLRRRVGGEEGGGEGSGEKISIVQRGEGEDDIEERENKDTEGNKLWVR